MADNANENLGCLFWFLAPFVKDDKAETEPQAKKEVASEQTERPSEKPKEQNKRKDYTDCYQKRYLLTKNEWFAHKKLKEIADQKGLIVCPKVRLLDLIEPRKGEKDWQTLFYKIQSKHVDFVICNKNMNALAIIELDDSSHDAKDRKTRDQFVDQVLKSVGYEVKRTRYIYDAILDDIKNELPKE